MENLEQFLAECPSDMRPIERMFLYSLVRGRRPQRVLEIGAFKGGSAMVIARALHANGSGRAVGIDPYPQADFAALPLHGLYELQVGFSPDGIGKAVASLGGPVDLVLIDGLHTYSAVRADILGVLPHLAPDSMLLLHDAFHYGVRRAIEDCLALVPGMVDCGLMCNTPSCETDPLVDPWITYCGLYALRYTQRRVPVEEQLGQLYRNHPEMEARFGQDLLDHNEWSCVDKPCQRCLDLSNGMSRDPRPRLFRAIRVDGVWKLENGRKRKVAPEEAAGERVPVVPFSVFQLLPK